MAVFLSPEWLQEMDEAASTSSVLASLGADDPLAIEQRVTSAPAGDVVYHVLVDANGAHVAAGRADAPQLTLTTDFETACALHTGATNAQQALIRGRLKVGGDAQELVRRADVLEALDDVFAAVRARTSIPSA